MRIFQDVMGPGIDLIISHGYMIPDNLVISNVQVITLSDHLDPTALPPSTAFVYNDNLYLTDDTGNIAFIDCHLRDTSPTAPIRSSHPEYRKAGAQNKDAGHLGLSLGQHPSIAMEQDKFMNRWGIWRSFERTWSKELRDGVPVHIIGAFVEGVDTYSPFWCIREEIRSERNEYILTNDGEQ